MSDSSMVAIRRIDRYSFYAMLVLWLGALIISFSLTKADGMAALTTTEK